MIKKSLYYRNFMIMAGVVLLSFLLLGIAFTSFSYRMVVQEKREAMSKTADEVVRSVNSLATEWNLSSLELRMVISMSSNASGYQIMLADTTGTVISCSDRDLLCSHFGHTVPYADLESLAINGEYSRITTLGDLYGDERYIVGRTLEDPDTGHIIGFALLSSDPGSMAELWRQSAGIFLFIAIIVMMLTFILSLVMSKRQAEPLNELSVAAHKFARGDFDARVSEDSPVEEIAQLSHAFNTMADALEKSENNRREFIANVSHELKTPMTTISGFADGLLDGTIPPEKQEQYLTVISSETRRLSRLVRSMLDMSQLQAMDTITISQKRFDISEVLRLTLLGLEGKILSRRLDVDAELPEDPIIVRGDKDSITQVVYNLIDNATKFADEGSTLRIALWKQGMRAYVSVEDTGRVIPEDELPLIFDRFHKIDQSRSEDKDGVGLGLYIVKTILDNHNEDIYVTSADGVTKFVFTLTIVQEKPAKPDKKSR